MALRHCLSVSKISEALENNAIGQNNGTGQLPCRRIARPHPKLSTAEKPLLITSGAAGSQWQEHRSVTCPSYARLAASQQPGPHIAPPIAPCRRHPQVETDGPVH